MQATADNNSQKTWLHIAFKENFFTFSTWFLEESLHLKIANFL
jgi:hypothetical protein